MTTGYNCVDCGREIEIQDQLSWLDNDIPIHKMCKGEALSE